MNKLHDKSNTAKDIEPKEGQRDLLCSNKKSVRCPSLGFINPNEVNELEALDYLASILAKGFLHQLKNERNS